MLGELYNRYFVEKADARVLEWSFMKDPSGIFVIICLYLYVVYVLLPDFMKNKKAYDLRLVLQLYNIGQIVICSTLAYGMLTSGWTTTYTTLGCQPIDYSNNKEAVRMLTFVYLTFLMKIVDLIETCFFILRRKQNQVTKLHVYHHCSMIVTLWIIVKYIGGGMTSFSLILNSMVHVLMYSYYFLAALGPAIRKRLEPLKPKLTVIQMVQFWAIVIHGMQALKPGCVVPNLSAYVILPNVVVIFGFFLNFYIKSYKKRAA